VAFFALVAAASTISGRAVLLAWSKEAAIALCVLSLIASYWFATRDCATARRE